MQIVKFDPQLHLAQLTEWLDQWQINHQVLDLISTTGWIVEGIAVVFAYQTNSAMCFIELMLCNKNVKPKLRDEMLDKLVAHLLFEMKKQGYKYVTSNSTNPSVVDRAKKFGFKVTEGQVFIKQL